MGVSQTAAFNRGRHLYSAGWPSGWALAHISSFIGFRVLAALLHGTLVVGVSQTAAFNRGRHLYSAGRPSGWALAHISSFILFLLSFFFFSSPNLSGRRLVWCGLSANLERRSETCCARLAGNTGRKKVAKNRHLSTSHNFVGLYLRN